jgi:hypothetical protein
MNFLKKTFFLACVLLATQFVYSQEVITVSAGEALGSGGSGTYSVGQVFYTTNTGTTVAVSQGVQHLFEFQTLSNPELITVNLTAVTYPNPTKDLIILKVSQKNKTFKILKHQ